MKIDLVTTDCSCIHDPYRVGFVHWRAGTIGAKGGDVVLPGVVEDWRIVVLANSEVADKMGSGANPPSLWSVLDSGTN